MSRQKPAPAAAPEDDDGHQERLPAVAPPSRALSLDLSIADLKRQKEAIRDMVKEVLVEGIHYGPSYQGDDKKTLHQPGADALIVGFGLVPRFTKEREDIAIAGEGMHREYTLTCTLFTRAGQELGSGIGSCSTMESKYRWRNARPKCPGCLNDGSLIRTKGGRNPGGWWCVPDKGGCGANYDKGDRTVEGQALGKVPNPDIADTYNTILKLGAKRAKVAATILVTGCADMFTQDLEESEEASEASHPRQDGGARVNKPVAQATAAQAPMNAPPAGVNPDHKIDVELGSEYGTLQVRADKKTAEKFWKQWPGKDQKVARLDAMRRANVALKAITDRLGPKAEGLLRDILLDRQNPEDVLGILGELERAATEPRTSAGGGTHAPNDEPPYAPMDTRLSV